MTMTTAQTAKMIELSAQGVPVRKQGEIIGVHYSTINKNQHEPEIRALIEREATELLTRGLKTARRTILRLAADGNTREADKDTKKLALDASKVIINAAGLSGQAPSTIINNLMLVNQAPEQAQELSGIQAFLSHSWQGGETIDAEIEQSGAKIGQEIGTQAKHTRPEKSETPTSGDQSGPGMEQDQGIREGEAVDN